MTIIEKTLIVKMIKWISSVCNAGAGGDDMGQPILTEVNFFTSFFQLIKCGKEIKISNHGQMGL